LYAGSSIKTCSLAERWLDIAWRRSSTEIVYHPPLELVTKVARRHADDNVLPKLLPQLEQGLLTVEPLL